jgi:hypothetical protein
MGLLGRFMLSFIFYCIAIQVFVMYNAFNGEKRQILMQPTDVNTLSPSRQNARAEIIRDVENMFNLKPCFERFDDHYINEDALAKIYGTHSVKLFHKFWMTYLQTRDTSTNIHSVTHYHSSIRLAMNAIAVTRLGKIDLNMTVWLELGIVGDSEKVVHFTEEWNDVPLLDRDNTVFPIGWTAEMLRRIFGQIAVQISAWTC